MKNADPVLRRLALLAQDKLTVNQWRKFLDAEYVMWAHAGKKLMPLLSDEQKLHLIDLGAHVAHTGKLMPNAAYRIAFANIKNLKRDGSNFFEYAEKIK